MFGTTEHEVDVALPAPFLLENSGGVQSYYGIRPEFINFKIETLRKFTSGIIYQFKSLEKLHFFYELLGLINILNSSETGCFHLEYGR